jgi:hypothetical protein
MPQSWFDPNADILEIADTELAPRARRMVAMIVRASAPELADNPVEHREDIRVFDRALGAGWREDQELLREVMSLGVIRRYTVGGGVRRRRTVFLKRLDHPVQGLGEVVWRFGPGVAPALAANPELQLRLSAV